MDNSPEPIAEPPGLRLLRVLVTVLMGVMILGLIILVAVFVIRFRAPAPSPTALPWPTDLALPDGVTARAITAGDGWFAVVTDADDILIFDADGAVTQTIKVTPE